MSKKQKPAEAPKETVKLTDVQWDALISAHDQGLPLDELIRLNVEEAKAKESA